MVHPGILAASAAWGATLCAFDCRERRLPNWLTVGGAGAALALRLGFGGLDGLVDGFLAGLAAGLFMLIPYLARGAGGGDVKMLAAAGAAAGLGNLIHLLWITSLAGIALGLIMLLFGRLDASRLKHLLNCMFNWRYDRKAGAAALPPKENERVRIPFSVPILTGLLFSLVARQG